MGKRNKIIKKSKLFDQLTLNPKNHNLEIRKMLNSNINNKNLFSDKNYEKLLNLVNKNIKRKNIIWIKQHISRLIQLASRLLREEINPIKMEYIKRIYRLIKEIDLKGGKEFFNKRTIFLFKKKKKSILNNTLH